MSVYINLGRWADTIIGPFEDTYDAVEYVKARRAAGYAFRDPKYVTVAPPAPIERDYVVTLPVGFDFTTTVRATSAQEAVDEVARNVADCGGPTWTYYCEGSDYDPSDDVR